MYSNKSFGKIKKLSLLMLNILGASALSFPAIAAQENDYGPQNVNISVNMNSGYTNGEKDKAEGAKQDKKNGNNSFDFLSSGDIRLLVPVYDDPDFMVLLQGGVAHSLGMKQTTASIGGGMRYFIDPSFAIGVNTFFDYYASEGNHHRFGVGLEALFDYGKLYGNFYRRIGDWKETKLKIKGANGQPETNNINAQQVDKSYEARAATGFDIGAQGFLPMHPQLGMKLNYEKYYGKQVALKDNVASGSWESDPSRLSVGINYTPISAITVGLEYRKHFTSDKKESDKKEENKKGNTEKLAAASTSKSDDRDGLYATLGLTYRFNVAAEKQFTFDGVNEVRQLGISRYDFVERNNQIVLEFQEKQLKKEPTTKPPGKEEDTSTVNKALEELNQLNATNNENAKKINERLNNKNGRNILKKILSQVTLSSDDKTQISNIINDEAAITLETISDNTAFSNFWSQVKQVQGTNYNKYVHEEVASPGNREINRESNAPKIISLDASEIAEIVKMRGLFDEFDTANRKYLEKYKEHNKLIDKNTTEFTQHATNYKTAEKLGTFMGKTLPQKESLTSALKDEKVVSLLVNETKDKKLDNEIEKKLIRTAFQKVEDKDKDKFTEEKAKDKINAALTAEEQEMIKDKKKPEAILAALYPSLQGADFNNKKEKLTAKIKEEPTAKIKEEPTAKIEDAKTTDPKADPKPDDKVIDPAEVAKLAGLNPDNLDLAIDQLINNNPESAKIKQAYRTQATTMRENQTTLKKVLDALDLDLNEPATKDKATEAVNNIITKNKLSISPPFKEEQIKARFLKNAIADIRIGMEKGDKKRDTIEKIKSYHTAGVEEFKDENAIYNKAQTDNQTFKQNYQHILARYSNTLSAVTAEELIKKPEKIGYSIGSNKSQAASVLKNFEDQLTQVEQKLAEIKMQSFQNTTVRGLEKLTESSEENMDSASNAKVSDYIKELLDTLFVNEGLVTKTIDGRYEVANKIFEADLLATITSKIKDEDEKNALSHLISVGIETKKVDFVDKALTRLFNENISSIATNRRVIPTLDTQPVGASAEYKRLFDVARGKMQAELDALTEKAAEQGDYTVTAQDITFLPKMGENSEKTVLAYLNKEQQTAETAFNERYKSQIGSSKNTPLSVIAVSADNPAIPGEETRIKRFNSKIARQYLNTLEQQGPSRFYQSTDIDSTKLQAATIPDAWRDDIIAEFERKREETTGLLTLKDDELKRYKNKGVPFTDTETTKEIIESRLAEILTPFSTREPESPVDIKAISFETLQQKLKDEFTQKTLETLAPQIPEKYEKALKDYSDAYEKTDYISAEIAVNTAKKRVGAKQEYDALQDKLAKEQEASKQQELQKEIDNIKTQYKDIESSALKDLQKEVTDAEKTKKDAKSILDQIKHNLKKDSDGNYLPPTPVAPPNDPSSDSGAQQQTNQAKLSADQEAASDKLNTVNVDLRTKQDTLNAASMAVISAQDELRKAETKKYDAADTSTDQEKQEAVDAAQKDLDDAEKIRKAADEAVEEVKKAVDAAQKDLDDAKKATTAANNAKNVQPAGGGA